MDDFIHYGETFDQALINLESFLKKCTEISLCLSNEKCSMLMEEDIILAHHILSKGIEVDLAKI